MVLAPFFGLAGIFEFIVICTGEGDCSARTTAFQLSLCAARCSSSVQDLVFGASASKSPSINNNNELD